MAYLARADESGTAIRALLFAMAGAALGFVIQQLPAGVPVAAGHRFSIALFMIAALLIFASWELQKWKALKRHRKLLKGKIEDYLGVGEQWWLPRNRWLDRWAAAYIGLAVVIEITIRFSSG